MNTRFAVATHILTLLHVQNGLPASSEYIAASVNTNPAVIRRVLQQLGKAGLTKSQMGTGGGALLARSTDQITLLDVYLAVEADGAVLAIHSNPNPMCLVGRNIQAALKEQISAVEQVMRAQLSKTTIANMSQSIAHTESKLPDRV